MRRAVVEEVTRLTADGGAILTTMQHKKEKNHGWRRLGAPMRTSHRDYATRVVIGKYNSRCISIERRQVLIAVLDSLLPSESSQKRAPRNSPAKHAPPNNLIGSSLKCHAWDEVRGEPPDDPGKANSHSATGFITYPQTLQVEGSLHHSSMQHVGASLPVHRIMHIDGH